MISQMAMLLRIKELKQEQAFRAMRSKRQQVEDAMRETEHAREVVSRSAATMSAREDAIYADVVGRVVNLGEVDEVRGKVVLLEKEHARLNDAWERAKHVEARLEGELETATVRYRQSTKVHDKYVIITDAMRQEAADVLNQREEVEVEDLFARARRRPA
jgi:accessory colonization factor AcfC